MSPEEKLDFVALQISEAMAGERDLIKCPYCGEDNTKGNEALCCKLFGDAVRAVLDRVRYIEAKDQADRILSKAARN